jgi:hypothetical protein
VKLSRTNLGFLTLLAGASAGLGAEVAGTEAFVGAATFAGTRGLRAGRERVDAFFLGAEVTVAMKVSKESLFVFSINHLYDYQRPCQICH